MCLVSARARQLNHRLKNRRTAIVSRRENDASLNVQSRSSDAWREANGHALAGRSASQTSPPSGFVAVNARRPDGPDSVEESQLPAHFMFSHGSADNVTIINGTSIKGASPTTRAELMKKFFTTADRQARGYDDAASSASTAPRPRPPGSDPAEYSLYNAASTPVAIPSTPSALLPPPKSNTHEKDDGGPFKLEMVARMEELQRGERVVPPCDRCRRLQMDCLKNLTACMGCTKKHAKCAWKDVKENELRAVRGAISSGERAQAEHAMAIPQAVSITPLSAERGPDTASDPQQSQPSRRESAPGAANVDSSAASLAADSSPRRAMSETLGSARTQHDRRMAAGSHTEPADDDDPDANQRLMQAILDTVDHHTRVAAAVQEKERGAERATSGSNERDPDRDRERRMVHA